MLPLQMLYFEDLSVGMTETLKKTIDSSDVVGFAEVTGDRNPIHLSEHFAAKTPFGTRIAHGLYTASLISAVRPRRRLHFANPQFPRAGENRRYGRSYRRGRGTHSRENACAASLPLRRRGRNCSRRRGMGQSSFKRGRRTPATARLKCRLATSNAARR
jgi:hypothetical protein